MTITRDYLFFCWSKEQLKTSKGKTWSRGTFAENVEPNVSYENTITSRCWIQLYALALIKDGTVFSDHCVFCVDSAWVKNDGLKNATCGRVFYRKQRKKIALKNIRIPVDRTLISLFQALS